MDREDDFKLFSSQSYFRQSSQPSDQEDENGDEEESWRGKENSCFAFPSRMTQLSTQPFMPAGPSQLGTTQAQPCDDDDDLPATQVCACACACVGRRGVSVVGVLAFW